MSYDIIPLSFSQQRIYFLHQLLGNKSTYNISLSFHLKGPIDPLNLEKSINFLVKRHESLRTCIQVVSDTPKQCILDELDFSLTLINIPHTKSDEETLTQAKKLLIEKSKEPFELAKAPLIRVILIKISNIEHILFIELHHIIADGWSLDIFLRELGLVYNNFTLQKDLPLKELSAQYGDFTIWQREWLKGEILENQLSYWKKQLNPLPPFLYLPFDRDRPEEGLSQGRIFKYNISPKIATELKSLGRHNGTTLFVTLLAVFQALLHRYSGEVEIVIGSPTSNRHYPGVENIIGLFSNTLVLKAVCLPHLLFKDFLAQTKTTVIEAIEHQDIPFEQLVDRLQIPRNFNQNPVFQVMFALETISTTSLDFKGITCENLNLSSLSAKFDLTLTAKELKEELILEFEYATDLFNEQTIARMAKHFECLLEGITKNPTEALGRLPLLSDTERYQLLEEGNDTRIDYPCDQTVQELFEAQVERTPSNISVVYEDQHLTYYQLNERANQLARYLREQGVGPEVLVAISLDRSLELIIAILAILKAGGAYVPLDPTYPPERLKFMLEDTQAPVVITHSNLSSLYENYSGILVQLDQIVSELEKYPTENLELLTKPHNLAYIIYTSGSTGLPKGVMIQHKNIVRLFLAIQNWYHFNPEDIWTFFHSYAFDFSVWEIWGPLLFGGKLIVVPYLTARSPEAFYDLLVKQKVTVLNQTPSAFKQLIAYEESLKEKYSLSLKWIIFGGEALDPQSLTPWFNRHGEESPRLINMYGITETTVHVTYAPVTKEMAQSIIGQPIPDLQIYILDSFMQPCPIGIKGELYIAGEGLARGYLNRPELTKERFIPNPFSKDSTARLYKTGDLGRFLADGNIEYLGRIDEQVKLRGYRIELGEIESVLCSHPLVQTSVVIVREDTPDQKRLVAYIVMRESSSQAVSIESLREFLTQKLPEYMVPSAFVILEQLPLTVNGKVDRKALPVPDLTLQRDENTFVAPRNEVEQKLADIFCDLLHLDKVGIHDNFFSLGGHSLLATQLLSRMRAEKLVGFTLANLFSLPTIADLSKNLNENTVEEAFITFPEITRRRKI